MPRVGCRRRWLNQSTQAMVVNSTSPRCFGGPVWKGPGQWLPGGSLGVDFFFVLSGYLITGLLIRQRIETGSISMLTFYVRRIRRLLPALILMITAVTAWTAFNDNPISWAERRGDIISTLFYYANWHQILSDQSYFAQYSGSRRFATRGRWLLKSSTI